MLQRAPAQRPAAPVTADLRFQVGRAFDGFIGNAPAVKRISNDLLRALLERPPHLSKNYLFTGQPSTGKTELARRMAAALELPFVRLDRSGVASKERLFDRIRAELCQQGPLPCPVDRQAGLPVLEYPPFTVFIDEVHLVPRRVQESLLTMLEAADRTVVLSDHVARLNRTTFLFATTRASDVDPAFRSRCAEVHLREYSLEEVGEMVRGRYPLGWPEETYREIARLGRCVPRVAIELARELETEIAVSEQPDRDLREHLAEVRRAREMDEMGLTPMDLQYLHVLGREARPVGETAVLNLLGNVDRDRVANEIEPFLIRLGFIRYGARGRELTPAGTRYVGGGRGGESG